VAARVLNVGREWHARLREFFDGTRGGSHEPLELLQAALDDAERKVQPIGRGRRVFPYDSVAVRLAARDGDPAPLLAAFAEFEARLRERLAELQCDIPPALAVAVTALESVPASWSDGQLFSLEFRQSATPARPARTPPARQVQIDVLKGAASEMVYLSSEPAIAIGRTSEVIDELGGVRRNQVAFADVTDGVTETVGRAHARLQRDGSGQYRVLDEGSRNGTAVIRHGTAMPVPRRDPRGVKLASGDEIQLGRAVIRVTFLPPDAAAPEPAE
jgi:hypothetical protein